MKSEIWLHVPTFTLALVTGDFIQFEFNGKMEESYWPILKEENENQEWQFVGYL